MSLGNVRVYKNTDIGAPTLSGTVGQLLVVLDAVLVNGYNSKTVTITRSGSTATANCTSHGYLTGDAVLHSGASQSEYNVEAYVTVVDADNYTFTVSGTPASPATGTITAIKAPAGWTKQYSGTNLAVYKQGNSTYSPQHALRIDDTTAASAKTYAAESFSDVNTGTALFPTAAQLATGTFIAKSITADSVVRNWVIVADDKTFYFFPDINTTGNTQPFAFGSFVSYKSGDAYNNMICGCSTASLSSLAISSNAISSAVTNSYIPRSYTQSGTSIQLGKHSDSTKASGTSFGISGLPYPNQPDSSLYVAPVWVTEPAISTVRGQFAGMWCPCHAKPLAHLDIFQGTGALSSRKFMAVNVESTGQVFMEISNTWYS